MMKSLFAACCSLLVLHAQELDFDPDSIPPEPPPIQLPPKEAAMDVLFSIPETPDALEAAVAEAKKQGVPEQTILEARFLYHVEHKSDQGIIDLLPIWEKQTNQFSLDQSEIFATKEDFLAVVEFARALKSLQEDKRDDFKKHITEALWLSPSQASAFTPYIESLRLSEHIKKTQIDLAQEVPDLHSGKMLSLKNALASNRALLLHFWSPWSPDCETSINDLSAITDTLAKEKVALASLLIDGRTEILTEAKEFLKGQEHPLPGPQLLDRTKNSLASQLRVTDMPTLVLLSPEGKILFHGKPTSPQLLEKISALPASKPGP